MPEWSRPTLFFWRAIWFSPSASFPGLKVDRTGAAIIGAVAMIAFRVVRPSDALRFIDFSTLVLLFSMMLIVGNLRLVGFLSSGMPGSSASAIEA